MAWEIDQVVELANKQTERRCEDKLDLRLEFWQMLQELLHEHRFWWARATKTFPTAVGTPTYDLAALFTGNSISVCFEEIIEVYRLDSATEKTRLDPILGEGGQAAALEATSNGEISAYMMEPEAWQTLRLGAPADSVKTLRIIGWANVNPTYDASDTQVPLVPGPLHYGLVVGLKRRLLDFLFGQEDPRWVVADKAWEKFIRHAARKASFTTRQIREIASADGDTVQAH